MVLQLREIYSPDDFPKPTRYDKARFIVVLQGNVTLEFDAGKGDISVDIDYYHKFIVIESKESKVVCPFTNLLYYKIEYGGT